MESPSPPAPGDRESVFPADFYGFADDLDEREAASIDALRTFLEAEVRPIADDQWDRAEFPHHLIPKIAELGLFADPWPQTRRFPNSSVYRGWCWMEIARVDPSMTTFVGVQSGLAMGAVAVGGSETQQAELLPLMARGELLGSFGLTEPLSGSDAARGLRTTARRDGDAWVLDGAKRWIGNATFSDFTIIFARDVADDEVKGFLVRAGTPGFRATKIPDKISLRTVQNADIALEGVRVAESDRLPGIVAFRDVATVLRLTRAEVAWQALGTAVGAYETALRYALQREQFGVPIASHQLVQDLLARSLGNITACFAMCVRVSRLQDQGRQRDAHAALAKGFVTSRSREVVAWAREILGGNGITLSHGVARQFADMEAIYSFEGTREMNSLIVGRAITGIAAFA